MFMLKSRLDSITEDNYWNDSKQSGFSFELDYVSFRTLKNLIEFNLK